VGVEEQKKVLLGGPATITAMCKATMAMDREKKKEKKKKNKIILKEEKKNPLIPLRTYVAPNDLTSILSRREAGKV